MLLLEIINDAYKKYWSVTVQLKIYIIGEENIRALNNVSCRKSIAK